MNTTTILWRLAWKEFRLLRDFWLAVLALCGVCLLIMAWRMKTTDDPANLFFVAMGITACYALGCGTMAFAGEREARTDDSSARVAGEPSRPVAGQDTPCAGQHANLGYRAVALRIARRPTALGRSSSPMHHSRQPAALPALLGGLTALQLLAWGIFFVVLVAAVACRDLSVSGERSRFVSDLVAPERYSLRISNGPLLPVVLRRLTDCCTALDRGGRRVGTRFPSGAAMVSRLIGWQLQKRQVPRYRHLCNRPIGGAVGTPIRNGSD